LVNRIDDIVSKNELQLFGNLEFIAKEVVAGFITGLHKSPFHGFSVEFAEHRLYNAGESIKDIDWKLYGRTDKLFVKKFEEETNLRSYIVIDNSSSMFFPLENNINKLIFSIQSAAVLIHLLKKQRDAVALTLFNDAIELITQARSSSTHQKYLYIELEKLLLNISKDYNKKTFTSSCLDQIAEMIPKRSLVIIFSDMFDNTNNYETIFSALQHLRHNKHEVLLFHVLDKNKEADFNYNSRPHKFIDLETKEEIKINPTEIKNSYQKSMIDFKTEIKMRCEQGGIDFIECDIKKGFNDILLAYLIKRKFLY